MTRYLFGLIGLALIGASPLLARAAACGEACACPEAACNCGCENGCGCGDGGCGCLCCPNCGCKLEPVCHINCVVKKEVVVKLGCKCKDICVPPLTPILGKCCDDCCDECCGRCVVHHVNQLVICPPGTKEHCAKECTVTWVCPKCGCTPCQGSMTQPPAPPFRP